MSSVLAGRKSLFTAVFEIYIQNSNNDVERSVSTGVGACARTECSSILQVADGNALYGIFQRTANTKGILMGSIRQEFPYVFIGLRFSRMLRDRSSLSIYENIQYIPRDCGGEWAIFAGGFRLRGCAWRARFVGCCHSTLCSKLTETRSVRGLHSSCLKLRNVDGQMIIADTHDMEMPCGFWCKAKPTILRALRDHGDGAPRTAYRT